MGKVCVIGSINMDVVMEVSRSPAAGEAIIARAVKKNPGGKGENAAIALAKLGVETAYYGCVGRDAYGDELLENLKKYPVDASRVSRSDASTGTAYIIVEESGENRMIVYAGANEAITPEDIRTICRPMIEDSELVLIQLEITREAIYEIIRLCRELGKRLVIDAGPAHGWSAADFSGAWMVSPNETELSTLVGRKLTGREEILSGARGLLKSGISHVIVKLGEMGSLYVSGDTVLDVPAYPVKAVDTVAAGDSYMAGLCKCLSEGMEIKPAMEYASKCGAVAVTRTGAVSSLPSAEDIARFDMFQIQE
ncbi:MAG: ribokinase [Eubacterium sp.]|nr:ribokinase [Eubacterium sp.]